MARKLKVFQTSIGFFDLAVAAPSMKAALEAWGAGSNLFHHGVAKQTDDPLVVAAAMSRPGVVFRRQVGTDKPFKEHAEVSTRADRKRAESPRGRDSLKISSASGARGDKANRKAAVSFEKERKRREQERERAAAAETKKRERQDRAIAKAMAALEKAKREHSRRAASISAERSGIAKREEAEQERWRSQKERLEDALRKVRDE